MPEKETLKRAQKDKREGKALTTQAGEFIREEIHHVREGKHGARSTKQAIAIGLSKARRAGVRLPPPEDAPKSVRRRAAGDLRKAKSGRRKTSRRRARATMRALKQAPRRMASRKALSAQARSAAKRRTARSRSAAAKKAARTRAQSR